MYLQKIIKHGNSLAVVLPVQLCHAWEIKRGDNIALTIQKMEFLVVQKVNDEDYQILIEKQIHC